MSKLKLKLRFKFILIIIWGFAIFSLGFIFGKLNAKSGVLIEAKYIESFPELQKIDFSPFWESYKILKEESIFANQLIDLDKTVLWASRGMVSSIEDPYTTFFLPSEKQSFWEHIIGEFGGIGVHVELINDILTVVSVIDGGPASKNGFKAGDKIISVDGQDIIGWNINDSTSLIKGEKGTKVLLTINRGNQVFDVSLIRDIIKVPTLLTKIEDDIFIIKLYTFNSQANVLFREAMYDFMAKAEKEPEKYNKLIVDLRGNPGGELGTAIDITSWFLPKNKVVLIEDFKKGPYFTYKSKGNNAFDTVDFSLIVLINEGSASASEIFAGAIKDHGIGILIGQKTFGKGTVQTTRNIGNSLLKYTIAEWRTPDDVKIDGLGIEPDIVIENDEKTEIDEQLKKAKEILLNS